MKTLEELVREIAGSISDTQIADLSAEIRAIVSAEVTEEMSLIAEAVDERAAERQIAAADVMAFAMLRNSLMMDPGDDSREVSVNIRLEDLQGWMEGYDFNKDFLPDGVVRYRLKVKV